MSDIEVHIDFAPGPKRVGTLHRHARRGGEAVSFEYHPAWLEDAARFSLEPALSLGRGAFVSAGGSPIEIARLGQNSQYPEYNRRFTVRHSRPVASYCGIA